jgi:hypothetical protein
MEGPDNPMTDRALAHATRYIETLDLRLMGGDISLADYRRKIDQIMAWLIDEEVPPAELQPVPKSAPEPQPQPTAKEEPACPTALLTSPFMVLEPSGS